MLWPLSHRPSPSVTQQTDPGHRGNRCRLKTHQWSRIDTFTRYTIRLPLIPDDLQSHPALSEVIFCLSGSFSRCFQSSCASFGVCVQPRWSFCTFFCHHIAYLRRRYVLLKAFPCVFMVLLHLWDHVKLSWVYATLLLLFADWFSVSFFAFKVFINFHSTRKNNHWT